MRISTQQLVGFFWSRAANPEVDPILARRMAERDEFPVAWESFALVPFHAHIARGWGVEDGLASFATAGSLRDAEGIGRGYDLLQAPQVYVPGLVVERVSCRTTIHRFEMVDEDAWEYTRYELVDASTTREFASATAEVR